MSKRNYHKTFIKVWFGLSVLVALYFMFSAGQDAQKHWYSAMVLDFIISAAWLTISGLQIASHKLDTEIDNLDLILKKSQARLEELINNKPGGIHVEGVNGLDIDILADQFMSCVMSVTNNEGRAPTTEEQPKILEKFHSLTDAYARFVGAQTSTQGNVEIDVKPFPTMTTVQRVVERPVVTIKQLTKSQQRRVNAKKGFGPITNEELKQQRSEKRKAARAAKKKQAQLPLK